METTIQDVYPRVREALVRCCDLEADQVTLDSRLVGDLGMESLDFIDLVYELEQQFEIIIPFGNLETDIEEAMGGVSYEVDGILTTAGLLKLREFITGLDETVLKGDVSVDEVPLLLTVRSVCGLLIDGQRKTVGEEPT